MTTDVTVGVGEFVALLNQTLEYAYPNVTITGELANFRVSKNRWVYFDLKDDTASVKFFGTIYQLPGPLEDGMMLAVNGMPRLHQLYGFSVTVQSMRPMGEGSIKKASQLLQAKLTAEGLFDEDRKRPLPYPPQHIGLITSAESAAYKDFMKIISARWGGVHISLIDVQVQGEPAVGQIAAAITQFNQMASPPEVLIITRGGGSAEDLQAFSTEQVTRAVAGSRIPTLVAIGHEVDISLAELAADRRASTPSNAAELLVPDRQALLEQLQVHKTRLSRAAEQRLRDARSELQRWRGGMKDAVQIVFQQSRKRLELKAQLLEAYDPQAVLQRGYALIRHEKAYVRGGADLKAGDEVAIQTADADLTATIKHVTIKSKQ